MQSLFGITVADQRLLQPTKIWYADETDADLDQYRLNTIEYTYDAAGNLLTAS